MFGRGVIALALYYLVRVINILVLARIVLEWVSPNPKNQINQFVYGVTEPILAPTRNLINNVFGYKGIIDFSPILSIFIIDIIYRVILSVL